MTDNDVKVFLLLLVLKLFSKFCGRFNQHVFHICAERQFMKAAKLEQQYFRQNFVTNFNTHGREK